MRKYLEQNTAVVMEEETKLRNNNSTKRKAARGRQKKTTHKKLKIPIDSEKDEASSDGEILIGDEENEIHTKKNDRLRNKLNVVIKKEK